MEKVAFFLIQIDTHPDTIGIVSVRYAAGHAIEAYRQIQATGTEEKHLYKMELLYIEDARYLERCNVIDTKYLASKTELTDSFSLMVLLDKKTPDKREVPKYHG